MRMSFIKQIRVSFFLALALFFSLHIFAQEKTTIYLTGNTDCSDADYEVLEIISSKKEENQILLLSGNISNSQVSKENSNLNKQLSLWEAFNGRVIATPGNNDWMPDGDKSVDKLEDYIQNNSKAKFYPNNGCPIKKKDLTDDIVLIVVDSQWFLEDWNKYPYINNGCDINNRILLFREFKSILRKSIGKTKIVAIHHPIATNTRADIISKAAGASIQDYENQQYRTLRKRLTVIAQQEKDVIFLSGHDKNLQFIDFKGVPQIISGSAQEIKGVKAKKGTDFAASKKGYAKLQIDKQGGAIVSFFEVKGGIEKLLHKRTITDKRIDRGFLSKIPPKNSYGATKKASVYKKEETSKSKLYKGLWGAHYREFYGLEIDAPVVFLDTLFGGLKPVRIGGGFQTKSLRLEDSTGKDFSLRALKKSGIRFLQATAFQDSYIADKLKGSFIDRFILDFYTTAHPFTPFAISTMADAVGVYHTNPQLFYVPKQDALEEFNSEYGNELYMIEERVEPDQKDVASFGMPDDILSTDELFKELIKDGLTHIDEPSYIRARIFDMLIGDWDRHEDQWRWAKFNNSDGTNTVKPIPRDRDQAFSIFDGSIISFLTCAIPDLRKLQSFDDDLRSPKWFNFETYYLDLNFVNDSDWSEWEKQAKFIQQNITDDVIEEAFAKLPIETQGEKIDIIKEKLKGRRANIIKLIKKYYDFYVKFEIVLGSKKDDQFNIVRMPNGKTKITVKNENGLIADRILSKKETKEIWIFGLDGKDKFNVSGKGDNLIAIKVVGGENNDTYDFKNKRRIKLFDYKTKKNTIVESGSKKRLVDDYDVNNFDHRKVKEHVNQFFPLISFNPDDGVRIGFLDKYSINGIQRNPFTQQHSFNAAFYTGTSGINIGYRGEFANIFHNWNFAVDVLYTSPNFAQNFFGFGNESENDTELDFDFNRVRIQKTGIAPSIIWKGRDGGSFYVKSMFETFEVENLTDRFIGTLPDDDSVFETQEYVGAEFGYDFSNRNSSAFPTRGFEFDFTAGYKTYVGDNDLIDNEFGYASSSITLDYALTTNEKLVLATKIGGEAIFGSDFEFYHGATIGGTGSLRGYRNERFIGKYAAYQNIDLRLRLGKFKTSFIPLKYGVTGGFDYGRVWVEEDDSNKWNNSYGGSFWVSGINAFTINVGYFNSTDSGRLVFVLGFSF